MHADNEEMNVGNEELELVEDDFTTEDHERLNVTFLMCTVDGLRQEMTHRDFVVYVIFNQLEREDLDHIPYEDAKNLLRDERYRDKLCDTMVDCAGRRDFRNVRLLRILREGEYKPTLSLNDSYKEEPGPPNGHRVSRKFLDFGGGSIDGAIKLAWNREYRGDYHRHMLSEINALDRNHTSCVSLIQSSGYGKSRMVDEVAKLVFTIPLNLRKPSEAQAGAYPRTDTRVWQYLCEREIQSVDDGYARTVLFFSNLFSKVADEVEEVFAKKDQKCLPLSVETFAKEWRRHLSENEKSKRDNLYTGVIRASRKGIITGPPATLQRRVAHLLAAMKKFCDLPKTSGVKIMLYIDEAHELCKGDGKLDETGCRMKLYDIVWSTLHNFYSSDVFTVFLSTQSSLSLPAPPDEEVGSARQLQPVLTAPFTETPFDCHPSFPFRPEQYTLAELGREEVLMRFGRPMFWTMYESYKQEYPNEDILTLLMDLARMKIIFDNHTEGRKPTKPLAGLALLDILITIDYEPMRQSTLNCQQDMVQSHMRTAFSIPKDCPYIRSGYPSEPFLAEAASRQMHHYVQINKTFMMGVLEENIEHGLIDLSHKDEVVMRFLLRKAYMDAIIAEQDVKCPNFSRGCSFVGFLKALFPNSNGFHDTLLKCYPVNSSKVLSPTSLEDAFGDAVVRFTHFLKAADSSVMTADGMVMGFLRGAAIIGHNSQKMVDIAIPILLHKGHKIGEASMSGFLVQMKRQHQRRTVDADPMDVKELEFFPRGSATTPYVTLVAELGIKDSDNRTSLVISKHDTRGSTRDIIRRANPQYAVQAYGCSSKTWGPIHADESHRLKAILGTDDLLGDHPRQNETSIQLVRGMLPFVYGSAGWYSKSLEHGGEEESEGEDSEEVDSEEESWEEDDMVFDHNT